MQAEPLDEMAGVAAVPTRLAPGEPLRELRHLAVLGARPDLRPLCGQCGAGPGRRAHVDQADGASRQRLAA